VSEIVRTPLRLYRTDPTDLKQALIQAEERTHEMAQRLITAQEEERTRIAAELHDDVSQQLAAMAIALSRLRRRLPKNPEVHNEIANLQREAAQLGETIRHLSHDLHPAVLQHVGLVPALRSRAREISRKSGLTIEIESRGDLENLPTATTVCLFRTAQEALHNVMKHARAQRADVRIERDGGMITMTVEDDGCGFDTAQISRRRGFGLITMDERARIAGGKFVVESAPLCGSKIEIKVPVGAV
jgi:two-component system sensor histidine kinase UhpB